MIHPATAGVGPKGCHARQAENFKEFGNGPLHQLANDFIVLAEKELSAFIRAVQKLFGAEQARKSALHWIEELGRMDWPSGDSIPDWRQVTVVASARLALWGPAIPIGAGKDLAPEEGDSCEHATQNDGPGKDGDGHDGASINKDGTSVVGQ